MFLHPSLIAGPLLLLVGVPVLIHLIHLLRHRRVKWAAMEFLLASQKKHRKSIWMRQLLLLLTRMAVVALVLLVLSQWVLTGQWGRIFGETPTHHIVLVDDSFPMAARETGGTRFDRAKQVARQIAEQSSLQSTPQRFTLLPWSKLAHRAWDVETDVLHQSVTAADRFTGRVREVLAGWQTSDTIESPVAMLDGIDHLLEQGFEDENRVLHLVSDFRAGVWQRSSPLRDRLVELTDAGYQLHLINCSTAGLANVAVTDLRPEPGTRAAGVPLQMALSVKNFAAESVSDVVVTIESAAVPPPEDDGKNRDPIWTRLPAVRFDEVAPGETAMRRFQVRFDTAGQHEVRASLDGDFLATHDALTLDNSRRCVLDVELDVPVLLVAGDEGGSDRLFVSTVLRPGPNVRTGLVPVSQPAGFLRDQPLDDFAGIFLLDVGRLEPRSVESLERYVRQGGGVAFFLGPDTVRSAFNDQLYRDGRGLFPLPLLGPRDLLANEIESGPDVMIDDDSAFYRLTGELYKAEQVRIARYLAVESGWQAENDPNVRVHARLRNGEPLIVERRFGAGRVVAVLTTAGRQWNDWPAHYTYPILLQQLQAHLAGSRHPIDDAPPGGRIELELDPRRFVADAAVTIRTPHDAASPWWRLERTVQRREKADGEQVTALFVSIGDDDYRETSKAGGYDFHLVTSDGDAELRRVVRNVAADQADLAAMDGRGLADALAPLDFVYHVHSDFQSQTRSLAGFNTSPYLLGVLLVLLVGEQLLAYAASYHPSKREEVIR